MTVDDETNEERIVRESASVKDAKRRRQLKYIGITAILMLIAMLVGGVLSYLSIQNAAKDATELAQQIQMECERPGVTDPSLAQFCPKADDVVSDAPDQVKSDPVPGPPGRDGEDGQDGRDGIDAPPITDGQILNAVRLFCNNTRQCRGEAGVDGLNASPDQVALAVRSYCDRNGQCRGLPGQNGTNGQDGTDGSTGPPPSETQIADSVASYCSTRDNCRGPAGPPGQNGSPGVVSVIDNCDPAPDGQVVADVNAVYNSESQTVVLSCTYKDDQTGVLPN